MACVLMVCTDRYISAAISGAGRWVDSIGSRRSSAAVSDDAVRGELPFVASRARSSLACSTRTPRCGPSPEDLVDLPHQRSGPGYVGEGEVDADKLYPGLHGVVGHRIGEQGPEPLYAGKRLAGGRDISPVRGDAGLRNPDPGLFEPGPAAGGADLASQLLGLAPVAAAHR